MNKHSLTSLMRATACCALLAVLPAAAQTPTQPAPTAPLTYGWHDIILQNVVPIDLLKAMHWNGGDIDPFKPVAPLATLVPHDLKLPASVEISPSPPLAHPNLPPGVQRIFPMQSNNSLLIEATDAGFAQMKQIVKLLDVAPRQVQIKIEYVTVSSADLDKIGFNFDFAPVSARSGKPGNRFLPITSGRIAAQLLLLLSRSYKIMQGPVITTTNNASAAIDLNPPLFFISLPSVPTIMPRINSDDSITLQITLPISEAAGTPSGAMPVASQPPVTLRRTISNGSTLALVDLYAAPPLEDIFHLGSKPGKGQAQLIFFTPTLVSESKDSQPVTVTP